MRVRQAGSGDELTAVCVLFAGRTGQTCCQRAERWLGEWVDIGPSLNSVSRRQRQWKWHIWCRCRRHRASLADARSLLQLATVAGFDAKVNVTDYRLKRAVVNGEIIVWYL
jgi:hypothetical protein